MADILQFNGLTLHDLPVVQVLDAAKGKDLTTVLVIGTDNEGELYVASDNGRVAESVYLLQRANAYLLDL
jgi:hypothetical protein